MLTVVHVCNKGPSRAVPLVDPSSLFCVVVVVVEFAISRADVAVGETEGLAAPSASCCCDPVADSGSWFGFASGAAES